MTRRAWPAEAFGEGGRPGRGGLIAIGSLQLTRPGYSVDEEFTVFAVRGIQAHGLPILPSGLLYDRGIAYSYAAWLAGAVIGVELPAFRAISLLAAAASVFLTVVFVRRVVNNTAALIAAIVRCALDSVLGHGYDREILRAISRGISVDADVLHASPLVAVDDRGRRDREADARARLHARRDSGRVLAARSR